jgi:hypothetical protein
MLGPAVAVIGLLWLALRALKRTPRVNLRLGSKAGDAGLAITRLGRLALTPTHSLHLIRVGDECLLLGAYGSGLTVIRTVEARPEREPKDEAGGRTARIPDSLARLRAAAGGRL